VGLSLLPESLTSEQAVKFYGLVKIFRSFDLSLLFDMLTPAKIPDPPAPVPFIKGVQEDATDHGHQRGTDE